MRADKAELIRVLTAEAANGKRMATASLCVRSMMTGVRHQDAAVGTPEKARNQSMLGVWREVIEEVPPGATGRMLGRARFAVAGRNCAVLFEFRLAIWTARSIVRHVVDKVRA